MSERQTGKERDPFDGLAESLQAHPSRSQILIEIRSEECTLEKALAILENLDINPVHHQVLPKGDPCCILFFLPDNDMREAVFRLTEAGFTRVKGINSRPDLRRN